MIKEEWRLHLSFQGARGSHLFPFFVFILSVFLSLSVPLLLRNMKTSRILLFIHLARLSYGLFVGAIGYIGEQVMTRRLGQVNLLLRLPKLYPVTLRRMMAIFFVKDAIYYIVYSIIPLMGGIALAAPWAGVTFIGVFRLFITISLTFMMGMGFSFLVTAAATKSSILAFALIFLTFFLVATVWPLGYLSPGELLLPLGYWDGFNPVYLASSTFIAFVLFVLAVFLTKERFETSSSVHDEMLLPTRKHLSFAGKMSIFVAKE